MQRLILWLIVYAMTYRGYCFHFASKIYTKSLRSFSHTLSKRRTHNVHCHTSAHEWACSPVTKTCTCMVMHSWSKEGKIFELVNKLNIRIYCKTYTHNCYPKCTQTLYSTCYMLHIMDKYITYKGHKRLRQLITQNVFFADQNVNPVLNGQLIKAS